jgi:hypothetical protein
VAIFAALTLGFTGDPLIRGAHRSPPSARYVNVVHRESVSAFTGKMLDDLGVSRARSGRTSDPIAQTTWARHVRMSVAIADLGLPEGTFAYRLPGRARPEHQ